MKNIQESSVKRNKTPLAAPPIPRRRHNVSPMKEMTEETKTMKSYSISFRIWHPTRLAEDISSKIGTKPVIAYNVGEQRRTPKDTFLQGNWRETYCVYDVMRHIPGRFTDGLEKCIISFESLAPVFDELSSEGGTLEFYVWIYPNKDGDLGFSLDADLIKRIGDFKFKLSVEIYL